MKLGTAFLPVLTCASQLLPFGAAQDICKSETNTFTGKVDLFASELGTFLRMKWINIIYLHFSSNHNFVQDLSHTYPYSLPYSYTVGIHHAQAIISLKNAGIWSIQPLDWKLEKPTRFLRWTEVTICTQWALPTIPVELTLTELTTCPTRPNWNPPLVERRWG